MIVASGLQGLGVPKHSKCDRPRVQIPVELVMTYFIQNLEYC